MIELKPIELADKKWIDPILKRSSYMGCENSFGCLYMWKDTYDTKVAELYGFVIAQSTYQGVTSCLFPLGTGEAKETIQQMIDQCLSQHHALYFHGVEPAARDYLEKNFPGQFEFEEYRSGFDYLYNSSDLIELAGKKYHSKRNHIANFMKNYDWKFEVITEENIGDCIAMNEEWCRQNNCGDDPLLISENIAVKTAIENFFPLELKGGLIRANGRVVAYSFGEEINQNAFAVHVEKAFFDIQGAYPIINREFSKAFCSGYQYINREDDVGVEGLRKAKMSYHPAILLSKCMAHYKGGSK